MSRNKIALLVRLGRFAQAEEDAFQSPEIIHITFQGKIVSPARAGRIVPVVIVSLISLYSFTTVSFFTHAP